MYHLLNVKDREQSHKRYLVLLVVSQRPLNSQTLPSGLPLGIQAGLDSCPLRSRTPREGGGGIQHCTLSPTRRCCFLLGHSLPRGEDTELPVRGLQGKGQRPPAHKHGLSLLGGGRPSWNPTHAGLWNQTWGAWARTMGLLRPLRCLNHGNREVISAAVQSLS